MYTCQNQGFIFCKLLETNQRCFSKSCQTIQPTPRHTALRINSVSCSHKLHTEANLSGSECPKFATFSMGYMLKP